MHGELSNSRVIDKFGSLLGWFRIKFLFLSHPPSLDRKLKHFYSIFNSPHVRKGEIVWGTLADRLSRGRHICWRYHGSRKLPPSRAQLERSLVRSEGGSERPDLPARFGRCGCPRRRLNVWRRARWIALVGKRLQQCCRSSRTDCRVFQRREQGRTSTQEPKERTTSLVHSKSF